VPILQKSAFLAKLENAKKTTGLVQWVGYLSLVPGVAGSNPGVATLGRGAGPLLNSYGCQSGVGNTG